MKKLCLLVMTLCVGCSSNAVSFACKTQGKTFSYVTDRGSQVDYVEKENHILEVKGLQPPLEPDESNVEQLEFFRLADKFIVSRILVIPSNIDKVAKWYYGDLKCEKAASEAKAEYAGFCVSSKTKSTFNFRFTKKNGIIWMREDCEFCDKLGGQTLKTSQGIGAPCSKQ